MVHHLGANLGLGNPAANITEELQEKTLGGHLDDDAFRRFADVCGVVRVDNVVVVLLDQDGLRSQVDLSLGGVDSEDFASQLVADAELLFRVREGNVRQVQVLNERLDALHADVDDDALRHEVLDGGENFLARLQILSQHD